MLKPQVKKIELCSLTNKLITISLDNIQGSNHVATHVSS